MMDAPELQVLSKIAWQFFATLTFESERLPERIRLSLFFALLREFCAEFDLKFSYLLWCLRQELGETLGRRHFHFLLAGAREVLLNLTTCFWLMDKWEKLGGGMARIHVFDRRLNAATYILKQNGFSTGAVDLGDAYESAKFASKACELMLADRVWKVAGWRSGYERARLARTQ
jgi:hypothetical protein